MTEHEAIFECVQHDTCHIVVNALAGTGKSYACRQAMKLIHPEKRVVYLAFNKSIVDEFSSDAPANAVVATLNGLGFKIVRGTFRQAQMDRYKVENIIKEIWDKDALKEGEPTRALITATNQLVELAQGYLLSGNNPAHMLEIAARHEVELDASIREDALSFVPQVLAISRRRTSVLSFNDQLWIPVVLNLSCPKYDVVFIDEAQDLNKLQHALVLKLLAPGGRVIVVGDTNQCIYGFRGSDIQSIPNLCKLLEETTNSEGAPTGIKHFPLTVSRRCAQAVVKEAQSIIPEFSALPDAPVGSISEAAILTAPYEPGNMVVCRCNAPLASLAMKLIQRQIKVVIRGKDIGANLISLIKRQKASDLNDLILRLENWLSKEMQRLAGTKMAETVIEQNQDRFDCIVALSEGTETITDLCATIENLFANFDASGAPKGAVICSSIHRAKGLEAERVFWLEPEISVKAPQPWQQVQERNLRYVAITRAKRELVYLREKAIAAPVVESPAVEVVLPAEVAAENPLVLDTIPTEALKAELEKRNYYVVPMADYRMLVRK